MPRNQYDLQSMVLFAALRFTIESQVSVEMGLGTSRERHKADTYDRKQISNPRQS